jgi:hypothetical protein
MCVLVSEQRESAVRETKTEVSESHAASRESQPARYEGDAVGDAPVHSRSDSVSRAAGRKAECAYAM